MKTNLKSIDVDISSSLPNRNSMDYVGKLVAGLKKVDKTIEKLDFLAKKAADRHTPLSILRTFPIGAYLKIDKAIAGNFNSDSNLLEEVYKSVLEWKKTIESNYSYVSYLNQANFYEVKKVIDSILFNIVTNENCSEGLISTIYKEFGDSDTVSFGVASGENCPKEILIDILKTNHIHTSCRVIEKVELDSDALNKLVDRNNGDILTAIVLHGKNVPLDIREKVVSIYKSNPFTSSFYYYPCLSHVFFNKWEINLEETPKETKGLWNKIKRILTSK